MTSDLAMKWLAANGRPIGDPSNTPREGVRQAPETGPKNGSRGRHASLGTGRADVSGTNVCRAGETCHFLLRNT